MLEFKDVNFSYSTESQILKGLNFKIEKGDFAALIGKSGCGKSTIFRLILGFEQANSGSIALDNKNSNIGYMPQKDLLFPWRSIEENLALPLEVQGLDKHSIKSRVIEVLEDMDLLHTKDLFPSELSGGMRQKIAFARTVLTGAELLLLDEPFSALDYFTRLDFQEWIMQQYVRLKKTIFFITHSVDEAILLGNKIFVFDSLPASEFAEISIDRTYPRNQNLLNENNIVEIKNRIITTLRSGTGLYKKEELGRESEGSRHE